MIPLSTFVPATRLLSQFFVIQCNNYQSIQPCFALIHLTRNEWFAHIWRKRQSFNNATQAADKTTCSHVVSFKIHIRVCDTYATRLPPPLYTVGSSQSMCFKTLSAHRKTSLFPSAETSGRIKRPVDVFPFRGISHIRLCSCGYILRPLYVRAWVTHVRFTAKPISGRTKRTEYRKLSKWKDPRVWNIARY